MDIALFSPASLFAEPDADSNDEENAESHQNFVERKHQFPGTELIIREFSFHQLNANLLWPGTFAFAECLVQNRSWMEGRRVIELGRFNGIAPVLPHIKHSWGGVFPIDNPDWDLVIASDILLYVKQYANLIKTLSFLLKSYKRQASEVDPQNSQSNDARLLPRPAFLMSWRRRIGKEDESIFFNGCDKAGLEVQHLGTRVYCILPREINCSGHC